MIELEKTYLAKHLPPGLEKCKCKEIIDIYLPTSARHPTLRIRKNGDRYEITKKVPQKGDPSEMKEETTPLTREEFEEMSLSLKGKRAHKLRYYYPHQNRTAEIGVFLDELKSLVLIDFEFETVEEKNNFLMPEFCLAEVTSEEFLAGGTLCGKKYEEIEEQLSRFGYKKLQAADPKS